MKTAKEKSNSKYNVFSRMKDKLAIIVLKRGNVRIDDVAFLLDLLESGCSRSEIEAAMNLTLHDPHTVKRFIGQRKIPHFKQLEKHFGFGFALNFSLHNRIRKAEETNFLLRTITYPVILILTGYCVSALFLFVIAPTIESSHALLTKTSIDINQWSQIAFILMSLFFLLSISLLIYAMYTRPYPLYVWLTKLIPLNPWTILESRKLAFHIQKIHAFGLSTREIYLAIESTPHEPVIMRIASDILRGLETGNHLRVNLAMVDPFLARILSVDIHPDFLSRLTNYERIAQKRYIYSVKKIGYFTTLIAYIFISVLIFTLYQEIMTPLDMLRNMG